MRLLSIGLLSVALFFPLYITLHPVLGANWAAGVAALMMYVGFPLILLIIFKNEWDGWFFRTCNYVIATLILAFSIWVIYLAVSKGEDWFNAIKFFWVYGTAALYYLAFGKFHINLKG